MACPADRPVG